MVRLEAKLTAAMDISWRKSRGLQLQYSPLGAEDEKELWRGGKNDMMDKRI